MSLATVSAAWTSSVWGDATVSAITDAVLTREGTEASEYEISQLRYGQEINFFEWVASEHRQYREVGNLSPETIYTVDVRYTREMDSGGANYTAVQTALNAVVSAVVSTLGYTWQGTVDFSALPGNPPDVQPAIVADTECWRATLKFSGTKGA